MMRTLGNTVAKSWRKGMLNNRDFSSAVDVVTSSTGKNIVDYCFVVASGISGYVFCGATVDTVGDKIQQDEERLIGLRKSLEKREEAFLKL